MGSSASTEYCAFTKAVQHLGDRWSLLIVRELAQFGPQGFNALAIGLPGRISRSVLMRKLRQLEELGLVARDPAPGGRSAPYRLAPAGEQLVPTLMAFREWARHWVPEDPALAREDPGVILWWLRHRVDPRALPERPVVVEFELRVDEVDREWLLLAAASEPELCLEDPAIGEDRYVFVEADAPALYPVARGDRTWTDAVADRSVRLYGQPDLVAQLPRWFATPGDARSRQPSGVGRARAGRMPSPTAAPAAAR
jgi:DNA-binding HxlR family transcriptional regulator